MSAPNQYNPTEAELLLISRIDGTLDTVDEEPALKIGELYGLKICVNGEQKILSYKVRLLALSGKWAMIHKDGYDPVVCEVERLVK